MSETHVVSALKAKRKEIAQRIRDLEKITRNWRAKLAHLDAALTIFGPEADELLGGYRQRASYFERGELSRLIADCLRTATGPITTMEIVTKAIASKGLPEGDADMMERIQTLTATYLRNLAKRGEVSKIGAGRGARWRLRGCE